MTDFSDLKTTIAEWANRQDWADALVTSFVRMAEQKFNAELRVDRMINFSSNTVTCRCSATRSILLISRCLARRMSRIDARREGPLNGRRGRTIKIFSRTT